MTEEQGWNQFQYVATMTAILVGPQTPLLRIDRCIFALMWRKQGLTLFSRAEFPPQSHVFATKSVLVDLLSSIAVAV